MCLSPLSLSYECSYYYWYGSSLETSQFFYFYFKVFVSTYFIIFFEISVPTDIIIKFVCFSLIVLNHNNWYYLLIYIHIFSDLTNEIKCSFFQAAVVSILLYGCTTWTLSKRMEKRLDGNYTRMLRALLNKSWRQHPTKQQLYGHLPPITETIKVWRTRHAGLYWRSREELISDLLLWTLSHGWAKARRPARIYIQQLGM